MGLTMNHIALLGDAVFANTAYLDGGRDVLQQVRDFVPTSWQVSRLAIDSATIQDVVVQQLPLIPADATHVVVSAGGYDGLREAADWISEPPKTPMETLRRLALFKSQFAARYEILLAQLLATGKPLTVCTIYDCCPLEDWLMAQLAATALPMLNDVITRQAAIAQIPVLDLRLICCERGDFARCSPMKLSMQGGGKVAEAIVRLLQQNSEN
jgi:hypothetical protein